MNIMRLLIFIFIFETMMLSLMNAQPVDIITAKKIASNYSSILNAKDFFTSNLAFQVSPAHYEIIDNDTLYYVFKAGNNGFIIVSGDYSTVPILGYSNESLFNTESKPAAFEFWMKTYSTQIRQSRKLSGDVKKNRNPLWNEYLLKPGESSFKYSKLNNVEPLTTSIWNQDDPYNEMCPFDTLGPGNHAYTGCVATAMAQIMYYFRYPQMGIGSNAYEDSDYGLIEADFGNTIYNWESMLDFLYGESNLAVAQLSFHCGVSVNMNYGSTGSGANNEDVRQALIDYFGYADEMHYAERDTTGNWKELLIDNLNNRQPVLYSGSSGWTGHTFVCDGYQGEEYYHFNWGWGGHYNGYFYIDNLNPGGYQFNSNQAALFNIFPNEDYPGYCNGSDTLKMSWGSFEDGSGPFNYQNNKLCSWFIAPEDNTITNIQFSFSRLDTELNIDVVTVYDGETTDDPILGIFSGNNDDVILTSSGNHLLVVFESNDTITGSGWLANYYGYANSFCDETTIYTTLTGNIDDGSGPYHYANNNNCSWLIVPQDPQYDSVTSIEIDFRSFKTEIEHDYITVYDGETASDPVLGIFSGQELPENIISTGNKVLIQFTTNEQITDLGWKLKYYSIFPEFCHDTILLTSPSGSFGDGSGLKNYTNESACYWLIAPPEAAVIRIDFTSFKVEYGYDRLNIFDPAKVPPTLLASYSGYEIPAPVSSQSGKMLLSFTSDYAIVFDGWEATYTSSNIGFSEKSDINEFEVFPNPGKDQLNLKISFDDQQDIEIQLINIMGMVVFSEMYSQTFTIYDKIDVRYLSKGIYVLKVVSKDWIFSKKVIMQ